jgi:hypothetical protein
MISFIISKIIKLEREQGELERAPYPPLLKGPISWYFCWNLHSNLGYFATPPRSRILKNKEHGYYPGSYPPPSRSLKSISHLHRPSPWNILRTPSHNSRPATSTSNCRPRNSRQLQERETKRPRNAEKRGSRNEDPGTKRPGIKPPKTGASRPWTRA